MPTINVFDSKSNLLVSEAQIKQKGLCHPELVSGSQILQISHKTNMFYLRC